MGLETPAQPSGTNMDRHHAHSYLHSLLVRCPLPLPLLCQFEIYPVFMFHLLHEAYSTWITHSLEKLQTWIEYQLCFVAPSGREQLQLTFCCVSIPSLLSSHSFSPMNLPPCLYSRTCWNISSKKAFWFVCRSMLLTLLKIIQGSSIKGGGMGLRMGILVGQRHQVTWQWARAEH